MLNNYKRLMYCGPSNLLLFGLKISGESILVCSPATKNAGIKLVQSDLPAVKSALLGDKKGLSESMKRALLEAIASKIATLESDVANFSQCTLLSKSIESEINEGMCNLIYLIIIS